MAFAYASAELERAAKDELWSELSLFSDMVQTSSSTAALGSPEVAALACWEASFRLLGAKVEVSTPLLDAVFRTARAESRSVAAQSHHHGVLAALPEVQRLLPRLTRGFASPVARSRLLAI